MSGNFKKSDHYNGHRFHNLNAAFERDHSLLEVLKWRLNSTRKPWPKQMIHDLAIPQISEPLVGDELRVTFVNHATLLIQWRSLNILTDPVFSQKLGPSAIFNLKRYRNVGIKLEDLPKIDYVFVSHNHYDHLDSPSLERLESIYKPKYITPLGNTKYFPRSARARVTELDWWQSLKLDALEIILVPAKHWSKRTFKDTNMALWSGAVFSAYGRKVYFAGDAAYSEIFTAIRAKLGRMDLSLLPIGAYEPRWFMKSNHMNPEEATRAHLDLESKSSLAIHFGTFRLTDEGIEDPVTDLTVALNEKSIDSTQFRVPKNGETILYK